MRNQKIVQTIVGFFMLLGIFALLFLALRVSGLTNTFRNDGYTVTATFQNIGSLKVRSPVAIAGVRIGSVEAIRLDPNNFDAKVVLHINKKFSDIPADTSASIFTEGLLGSNYISLAPGYEKQVLQNGSVILNTHSAMILENLIGQLMYKVGGQS